jgi:hypothetical protein
VKNPISGNAVLDTHTAESINLDADQSSISCNINTETLLVKQRRKVNMEMSLRNAFRINLVNQLQLLSTHILRLIESIRVKSLVGHNMVLQQRLQVLLPVFREKESIDLRAKFPEGPVGGSEECSARVVGLGDFFEETSLHKRELERTELSREELDDFEDFGRWEEKGVDAVDYTVGSELDMLVGLCGS